MKKIGNQWLTLIEATDESPAVRVLVAPIGRSVVRPAQLALREVLSDTDLKAVPPHVYAQAREAYTIAAAVAAIKDWEAVGDLDGQPLPVSAEAIKMLMEDDDCYDMFDGLYVTPYLLREAEKNVSSLSVEKSTESDETNIADNAASSLGKNTAEPSAQTEA